MAAKIILVYPSSSPDIESGEVDFDRYKSVPIGILNIASWLDHNRYDVRVIDGRAYTKKHTLEMLKKELPEALCVAFGITTVQIKHGLHLSEEIRKVDKSIPIIWGGIHPTMFPLQSIREPIVDYVLYGEVEYPLLDLIKFIEGKKKDIDNVKGLVYKKEGQVVINPMHPGINPNELPAPKYELLDIEQYIEREFLTNLGKIRKMRALDINTSRGCPYRCNFCPNTMDVFKRYRVQNLDRVFQLIEHLVETYKLDHIWFCDELFFVEKSKVRAIAEHLIEKNYNITWESNARVDQFNDRLLNDELLALIKKSGCYALRMGMESGSDRILRLMKKDSTVADTMRAVQQCEKYGIIPIGNFIIGFPTETKEEMVATAKLILKLKEISPNGLFYSPGLLRPYPGTEIYEYAKQYGGFDEPRTLREWAEKEIDVGLFVNPRDLRWVKDPEWVLNFQVYFYVLTVMKTHQLTKQKLSPAWKLAGKISEFRLNHNFWSLGIEPKMMIGIKKFLDKNSVMAKAVKKTLSL